MKNVPARVETNMSKARDAGKGSVVEELYFEKLIRRCYLKTQNAIAIANVGISALSSMEYHTLLFFRSLSSKLPFCFSLDATLVEPERMVMTVCCLFRGLWYSFGIKRCIQFYSGGMTAPAVQRSSLVMMVCCGGVDVVLPNWNTRGQDSYYGPAPLVLHFSDVHDPSGDP